MPKDILEEVVFARPRVGEDGGKVVDGQGFGCIDARDLVEQRGVVGLTLGQSLGVAWQEISMPDFGRDVLGTDELAGLFNQKLLGLDPDGIPAEFSSHRRDDPKSAPPFAKEVPDRKLKGFYCVHGAINIAKVASDILLDRPAVPGVPIGL